MKQKILTVLGYIIVEIMFTALFVGMVIAVAAS